MRAESWQLCASSQPAGGHFGRRFGASRVRFALSPPTVTKQGWGILPRVCKAILWLLLTTTVVELLITWTFGNDSLAIAPFVSNGPEKDQGLGPAVGDLLAFELSDIPCVYSAATDAIWGGRESVQVTTMVVAPEIEHLGSMSEVVANAVEIGVAVLHPISARLW